MLRGTESQLTLHERIKTVTTPWITATTILQRHSGKYSDRIFLRTARTWKCHLFLLGKAEIPIEDCFNFDVCRRCNTTSQSTFNRGNVPYFRTFSFVIRMKRGFHCKCSAIDMQTGCQTKETNCESFFINCIKYQKWKLKERIVF